MNRIALLVLVVSSVAYAEPPPCTDQTDVVGYRRCPIYGTWGQNLLEPYMFIDLGVNSRHFDTPAPSAVARTTSPVPTDSVGQDALTFDMRIMFGVASLLYAGVETEFGDFATVDGYSHSRDVMIGGLGVAGLRIPLPFIQLSGEIAGGGRSISYADRDENQWVAEARARAELWTGPWFTLGAVLGTSLIDKGWMAGVYLGCHSYAFGGSR